jgi:TPR repeat protein
MYETGKGVKKSVTEARRFYRMTADQGDTEAKQRLAKLGED